MITTSLLDKRWNSYTEKEKDYLITKCRAANIALENGDEETANRIEKQLQTIAEFHFATLEKK